MARRWALRVRRRVFRWLGVRSPSDETVEALRVGLTAWDDWPDPRGGPRG